jgi:hypothetical protein
LAGFVRWRIASLYPNTLYRASRFVKYEFVSIPNNAGTLRQTAVKEHSRDKNGNVTEIKESDFIPYSGRGTVPRNTLTTFSEAKQLKQSFLKFSG